MPIIFDKSKTDGCLNTFREIFSDPYKSGDDNAFTGDVILPLDFSIEMDGLSGIIPHSVFVIPSNSLPKSYLIKDGIDKEKQKIAFILHTIEQNFANNKWTTKMTGQVLNIRFEPLTEEEKKAIEDAKAKQKSIQHYADTTKGYGASKNKQDAYDKAEAVYPGFKAKLRQVAANIGVSEDALVTVMYKESGIRPNIKNSIGCVGLVQFCPDKSGGSTKTIKGITYNLSDIQNSGLNQLDYIEKYFKALGFNSGHLSTAGDLYGATFYPVSKGKPLNWIMGSEKSTEWAVKVAKSNPGIAKFSTAKIDGQTVIDKAAFEKYVYA
jgi:D-Tyr-tRNAtyr deacylase